MSIMTAARLVVQELFRDPVNAAAKAATEAGVEGMAQPEVQLTCTVVIPAQVSAASGATMLLPTYY